MNKQYEVLKKFVVRTFSKPYVSDYNFCFTRENATFRPYLNYPHYGTFKIW